MAEGRKFGYTWGKKDYSLDKLIIFIAMKK